jgi:hypothetical protein
MCIIAYNASGRNVIPKVIHVLQLHVGLFALGVITEYQVAPLRGALLPLQMLLVQWPSLTASRQSRHQVGCPKTVFWISMYGMAEVGAVKGCPWIVPHADSIGCLACSIASSLA